ncbi:hypothetical protein ABEY61_26530, partial [Bacillus toyonensis]|uniref:hypothetical protein n=1 Tax=Bacillus toyonensis TaxID=155322 RepID=UPI003D26170C
YQGQNKKENLLATPNRNSSPTYRWATPFTRLRKENSFGKFVKNFQKLKLYCKVMILQIEAVLYN